MLWPELLLMRWFKPSIASFIFEFNDWAIASGLLFDNLDNGEEFEEISNFEIAPSGMVNEPSILMEVLIVFCVVEALLGESSVVEFALDELSVSELELAEFSESELELAEFSVVMPSVFELEPAASSFEKFSLFEFSEFWLELSLLSSVE
jgi:hypothetical protein